MEYVSSSIKRLKQRLNGSTGNAEEFKNNVKKAVNAGIDNFAAKMQAGQIQITSVADFDRLVKLGLLVHGEPTEIVENQENSISEEFKSIEVIKDTSEFEAIKALLSAQMNERNAEKG